MSINIVTISGNLTRDPEQRAAGNTPVLSFSVAVNDRVQQNGQWVDRPNYIDCTLFGGRVPWMAERLRKGSKVTVQGKLRQETWTDKNGQNHSSIKVIVDQLEPPEKKAAEPVLATYEEDVPF